MLGIGVDIVKIARVEAIHARFGSRFSAKVLSSDELINEAIDGRFLAKRFAAKEAVAKALGTGFRDGITMPDIRITKNALNQPSVVLLGAARRRLAAMGGTEVLVSISDEVDSAVAFAVAK